MKRISILGAGLSATCLINYLIERSDQYDWEIHVGDYDESLAKKKTKGHPRAKSFAFDVKSTEQVEKIVGESDIIVSMMPAAFHHIVAEACIKLKTPMLTASYVTKELRALNQKAKDAGIGIFMELGVDPGIDHMSAMKVIDKLRAEGSKIDGFYSSTGGLIAPEYDNNPWNYKFTWNPRNVVVAGQGISMFIRNGRYKYIPYHQLFSRLIYTSIKEVGDFEIYPNRDSLKYRETYNLEDIPTIYRGTMRRKGFAKAWNIFVQLGLTDDTYVIEDSANMTFRDFINTFLPFREDISVEEKLMEYFGDNINNEIFKKLEWLDIFKDIKIPLTAATPAQILQHILERKWQLEEGDKDMIVMQHRFEFTTNTGKKKRIVSSIVVKGKTNDETAMAITVGTPLAIAVKMVALGELTFTGVHVPVSPEIYNPILTELEELGIRFTDEEFEL